MQLKGIKVLFLTDSLDIGDSEALQYLRQCISEEGGEFILKKYDGSFLPYFIENKFDLVIFNVEEPIATIKLLKQVQNNFAAIYYTEDEYIENLTSIIHNKFDTCISKPTIGCWYTHGCPFSKERVIHKIKYAIKVHALKYEDTIDMINKFVHLIECKQDHTLLDIVDSTGRVIAIDANVRRLFGDIVGTNVQDIPHKYKGIESSTGEPFKLLKEGAVLSLKCLTGNFIDLKLTTQWVFENGQTFYIQVWENLEETRRLEKSLKTLDTVVQQLKNISNPSADNLQKAT